MTKPADSDQIARRWLQKTFNSTGPNHQFSFDEDGMVELVLKPFAASERQAVIEECAKVADNITIYTNDDCSRVRNRIVTAIRSME